jgi:proline dehydrogenase
VSTADLKWRAWQQAMIRAARSGALRRLMQGNPLTRQLARRFVGGASAAEALQTVNRLARDRRLGSPYYLGEYVDSLALVQRNVEEICAALETFRAASLPTFFSVDPTQIGYSISGAVGEENALRIAAAFGNRSGIRFLMVDMEDASYVDRTIALYHTLRDQGVRVAITLQAYLRRTEQDLERLLGQGATVRLVKGAFTAGKDIAWTRKREVDAAYQRLALRLLAPEMRARGTYPILATHDEPMLDVLLPVVRSHGWQPDEFEIEMLLGVREALQRRLANEGHTVRVYVPFGTAWWPYTARRVGENPANLRFVLQALWGR